MSWLTRPWKPRQLDAPALAESWLLPDFALAWKPGPWEVKVLSPKHTSWHKGRRKGLCPGAGEAQKSRRTASFVNVPLTYWAGH